MARQNSMLMTALQELSNDIFTEKQAALGKTAGPTPADPGGYMGKSDHPSAKVDNNAEPASEGARSAENERDVKDAEKAPSVNNTTAPSPDADLQSKVQYNIGTEQAATGEDPKVEDNYKEHKEDPGTSLTPTNVETNEKYGSMSIKEAHAHGSQLANSILADLSMGYGQPTNGKTATAKPAAQPGAQPAATKTAGAAPAPTPAAALAAGYDLAAELGLTKEASMATAGDVLLQIMSDASLDADLVGGYLKSAADGPPPKKKDDGGGDGGGDGSDGGSDGGSSSPMMGGSSDPASAMGGAGDSPGLMGGELGGNVPPDGGVGAAAGGPPPGGDPSGGGGAPNQDQALQELVAALQEMGITPDMLMQAASAGGPPGGMPGGAPGGPPPGGDPSGGAGGMPPGMPPGMDPAAGMKAAAAKTLREAAEAVHAFQLSGRYEIKEAGSKKAREMRNHFKSTLIELLNTLHS